MAVNTDEMLEALVDVMDNGGKLPQTVSNRMLLAAVCKNYRVSSDNAITIEEKLIPRIDLLKEIQDRHDIELKRCTERTHKIDVEMAFLVIGMIVMIAVLAWSTGIDLGWLPLL